MKYRTLKRAKMELSEISLGCMSLGTDKKQVGNMVDLALELGINFFDTADLYDKGLNESLLGEVLGQRRKEIYLCSKVGNQWREDGSGWDWNPTKKYILSAIEKSLKRLNTDYLDLYLLHGGTIEDNIDESIEAFELLKQKGLIRAYGISSIRPNVIREYVSRSNAAAVMMQYSILDRRPEESCLGLLEENDIGVLVRGAVAKGMLLNKQAKDYLEYTAREVEVIRDKLEEMASDPLEKIKLVTGYPLSSNATTSLVLGASAEKQLRDNILAQKLSIGLEKEIASISRPIVYQKHR